jgi:hypothetical protein
MVVVLLGAWLVYELMNDPYEERKSAALAHRTDAVPDQLAPTELPAGLDYESIQRVINTNQRLWGPLVQKPKPPPEKPNLEAMIKGLEVVTVLSENNELKCIIKDKNTHTVCKKGDTVRELTIDSVTPTHVVLSYKGQTIKLAL